MVKWNEYGPVFWWWCSLTALGAVNILLWLRQRRLHGQRWPAMVWLSGLYVFGCAIRGFFPKVDVERFALFDHWLSNVLVGRSVATVAELAFAAQWALILQTLGRPRLARFLLVAITLAECFSWYAVITTHFLGNVLEESLWATSFTGVAFSLWQARRPWPALACAAYVGFMAIVDVPMYVRRLLIQLESQASYRGLFEGLADLSSRREISWSLEHWAPEMPWMTLYFSIAVWMSLWLCSWPNHRREST